MAAVTPISGQGAGPVGRAAGNQPAKNSGQKFSEVLSGTEVSRPVAPAGRQAQMAADVLSRVEAGQNRLDEIIRQARSGKRFRPRELLALQAEVYRISEELSLVNKVVQEGVSGVKRLWNLQV